MKIFFLLGNFRSFLSQKCKLGHQLYFINLSLSNCFVVTHQQTRRPICVVTHDPRLPDIKDIQLKHWTRMKHASPYLAEVFPKPPLVAFKRQKLFKDYIIRSKVPPLTNMRPKRLIKGMRKCGKPCPACPYVREGKEIPNNETKWTINSAVNCNSYNIIYLIEYNKPTC